MLDYSKVIIIIRVLLFFIFFSTHIPNRPVTSQIENEDVKKYAEKYLNVGEWVMDTSIGYMNSSPYFEQGIKSCRSIFFIRPSREFIVINMSVIERKVRNNNG
ncbi:unnamed protein product [Rhizopus stolonifer]